VDWVIMSGWNMHLTLLVLPVLYRLVHRRDDEEENDSEHGRAIGQAVCVFQRS